MHALTPHRHFDLPSACIYSGANYLLRMGGVFFLSDLQG